MKYHINSLEEEIEVTRKEILATPETITLEVTPKELLFLAVATGRVSNLIVDEVLDNPVYGSNHPLKGLGTFVDTGISMKLYQTLLDAERAFLMAQKGAEARRKELGR